MTALEKKLKKILGDRYTGPLLSYSNKQFTLTNHDGHKIRILARGDSMQELIENYQVNTGEAI